MLHDTAAKVGSRSSANACTSRHHEGGKEQRTRGREQQPSHRIWTCVMCPPRHDDENSGTRVDSTGLSLATQISNQREIDPLLHSQDDPNVTPQENQMVNYQQQQRWQM